MLNTETRTIFDEEHAVFRDMVRKFFARAAVPHLDRWESEGIVDRAFWLACGDVGILCPGVPESCGGLALDFRYNAIIDEELAYLGSSAGITLHSDIVADYLIQYGSDEQRQHWLPRMVRGESITAIAMTEPGAGSDLRGIRTTARRVGGDYVVNGSKTYITNGQQADLIIVVAKTDPSQESKAVSLILVESARSGVTRGRNLDKIGQASADTSELFFEDVRVPEINVLGREGEGLKYLMTQLPQERLMIAVSAQATAQRAFDEAVKFTKSRKAFGQTVFDFQNTRFTLADMGTRLQIGWAHLDWAIARHVSHKLSAAEASAAKLWHTEMAWDLCDESLQLHGGAGYMNEYPIARLWRDTRVQRIYGGTSEIMKEVVARSLD